jgi:hypothetical protein
MYKSIGLGWPELLALKYKVKNFSMGGSGIYYSYDIFKQVHSEFDIIIFIPSQSTRFSLYCPDYGQVRHMVPGFLLGQASRELENLRILNRLDDYKATEAAIGYVTYILDEKKEDEMKRLMLQEVKRLRPDTIVIPAFPDDRIADSDIVMCEISGRELHMYNTSLPVLRSMQKPLLDLRKCHMTDENNRMLFHKIMTAIDNQDTSVRLAESDILQPKDPFTKYFVYENGRTNI